MAPNNYMGGVAPIAQSNFGVNPAGGYAWQPSSWSDRLGRASRGLDRDQLRCSISQCDWHAKLWNQSIGGQRPRSGGMQVIDMTSAPVPPGYRPVTTPSFPNQFPTAVQANPNLQQGFEQGWQQGQQQPVLQQSFQNPVGLQPIITPNPGEIANNLRPISRDFPPASQFQASPAGIESVPRTATLPTQGPSTEPVNSSNLDDTQNLPWRRPGTVY